MTVTSTMWWGGRNDDRRRLMLALRRRTMQTNHSRLDTSLISSITDSTRTIQVSQFTARLTGVFNSIVWTQLDDVFQLNLNLLPLCWWLLGAKFFYVVTSHSWCKSVSDLSPAQECCRISLPRFMVECRMMWLNQGSFVLLFFAFWGCA